MKSTFKESYFRVFHLIERDATEDGIFYTVVVKRRGKETLAFCDKYSESKTFNIFDHVFMYTKGVFKIFGHIIKGGK